MAKESARVILVATHAADKDQHYNPLGILRDVEPHLKNLIVDQIEVDSLTGHNIDKLKDLIAKYAISLPIWAARVRRRGRGHSTSFLT